MKKPLLYSVVGAACLALPAVGLIAADTVEKTVISGETVMSNSTSDEFGGSLFHSGPYSIFYAEYRAQYVYTASDLQIVGADEALISGISFNYNYGSSSVNEMKYKVYMSNTDDDRVYSQLTDEMTQTLVFDGTSPLAQGTGKMEITLDTPFAYETSKNLMITIVKEASTSWEYYLEWEMFAVAGKQAVYQENSDTYVGSYLPVMGIRYTAETTSDVVDLAASKITVPAKVFAGDRTDVKVDVVNNGTVAISDYKVEIVNVTADGETVIATASEVPAVEANASAEVTVPVDFVSSGTYRLAARVTAEGDVTGSNDLSPEAEVSVVAVNLKDITLAGAAEAELGSTADYKVGLTNSGSSEVSAYSLEIVRLIKDAAGNVYAEEQIASLPEVPSIAAGATAEITVPVTFELGGEAALVARVHETGVEDVLVSAPLAVNVTFDEPANVRETLVSAGEQAAWGWDYYITFAADSDVKCCGEETVYPASLIDLPRNGKIYSVEYRLQAYEYGDVTRRYQIYMANTDRTGFEKGAVATIDDMTLVYDGCFEFTKCETGTAMKFELQRPFDYEAGRNLAVLVMTLNDKGAYLMPVSAFRIADVDYPSCYAQTYNKPPFDFNTAGLQTSDLAPVVTLGYELEAIEAQTDMETLSVAAPAGDVKEGAESTFRVTVRNAGTVAVDGFRVELLDVTDESSPAVVVGEKAVDEPLGAGAQQLVAVKGSFNVAGARKVSARVITDGDIDAGNNECAPIEVTVTPADGVSVIESGSGLVTYADGTLHVGVGDAVAAALYAADGRVVANMALDGAADVSMTLAGGIYVARIGTAGGRTLVAKIIVK